MVVVSEELELVEWKSSEATEKTLKASSISECWVVSELSYLL